MAQDWQAFPSAFTNGYRGPADTFIDPVESLGTPADAAATEQNSTNSAFALAKGILAKLGVPAGSGTATTNLTPLNFVDAHVALGSMSDPPATGNGSGAWSAISLLKGTLAKAGL